MEWVKLVAQPPYYFDAALLRAGEAAEVLFTRALAYCGGSDTRGRIDKTVVPMIVAAKSAARADALVREGLWIDNGDHYVVRSWERWQDEHDAAAERRRKDRDRKRTVRRMSADSPQDVSATSAECRALDREGEEKREPTPPRPAVAEPDGFAEFWAAYPSSKGGRKAAADAYRKALKSTDAASLLAGAVRYRDDPSRKPEYTAHARTWLNAGRWEDEPTAAVRPASSVLHLSEPERQWAAQQRRMRERGGLFGDGAA